jgi:hypothetical protein
MRGRGQSEDLGGDVKIILKRILGKQGGKVWTGCIWLRTGISGGLLRTLSWTFGFHRRPTMFLPAKRLSVLKKGLAHCRSFHMSISCLTCHCLMSPEVHKEWRFHYELQLTSVSFCRHLISGLSSSCYAVIVTRFRFVVQPTISWS